MNRTHILLSLLLVLYCGSASVFAQKRPLPTAEKKKWAAKNGPAAIVKSWDKNKDGMLQQSEIPEAARGKVLSSAKARGLDPNKPIKIEALIGKGKGKAGDKASKKLGRGVKRSEEQKAAAAKDDEGAAKDKTDASNAKAFGQKTTKKKSSGFNKSESETDSGEDNEQTKKQREARKRLAPLAKSMMFQYDKNKNGKLDKREWKGLSGEPWRSDRDRDGALSMSELTDHLGGFGSREKDVTARSKAKRNSRKSSVGKDGKKLSYRFLRPHERLPKELPAWWVERDENGDGQLTLREFASTMNRSKVEKFVQFDLNGDGMLVAKEYLKATD